MSKRAMKRLSTGFTLIELLVGLMLFSLLSIALYSGLHFAVKSMATGEKHAQEALHVMAVHDFLRSKISQIKNVKTSDGTAKPLFEGSENTLQFVSDMPRSVSSSKQGLYAISVKKKALSILFKAYDEGESLGSLYTEPVQLLGIKKIGLMYFGRQQGEQKKSWYNQWNEQHKLPSLVKIELETLSGLVWPPIIVPVNASPVLRRL